MNVRILAALCAVAFALTLAGAPAAENAAPAAAQPPQQPVPPELQKVLDGIEGANKKVQDVRAKVNYLREIPLLDKRQESGGTLAFQKPDLVHLKLEELRKQGEPQRQEVYCDGTHWWVISHNDKQVEIYQASKDTGKATEALFLTVGYGQSPQKLLEKYEITLGETRKEKDAKTGKEVTVFRLQFVPRDTSAPARYAKIETEVADDLWLPRVIVLHESEGEIIHTYRLSDVELNPDLEKKDFVYEPPKGYQVIEP